MASKVKFNFGVEECYCGKKTVTNVDDELSVIGECSLSALGFVPKCIIFVIRSIFIIYMLIIQEYPTTF